VIISADGLYYCYTERDGEMALVDANPEKFTVISKFKVPMGVTYNWAHPVISHGMLFIRHGEALMAYDINKAT
jgi:outer membrane protein assembly factor BamB